MDTNTEIANFYCFENCSQEKLRELRAVLENAARELSLGGLIIIAEEGINGSISGSSQALKEMKQKILSFINIPEKHFKHHFAPKNPFARFKVKVKKEIVTSGLGDKPVLKYEDSYLSPQEWNEVLKNEDVLLIDTRNDYETKIGKFKGALDPNLSKFTEFPDYVEETGFNKDKKVLMYCTGGIRCEKAIHAMKQRGFKNVYQLHGGILKYFEAFPDGGLFEGECFVFDHRVAIGPNLEPSKRYALCPHCGDPADQIIECVNCMKKEAKVCEECIRIPERNTCSKNCAYHARRKTQENHID